MVKSVHELMNKQTTDKNSKAFPFFFSNTARFVEISTLVCRTVV